MRRLWRLLVAAVILTVVFGLTQPAVAADGWTDQCNRTTHPVPSVGTYTGQQDSDSDTDVVPIVLNEGDTVGASLTRLTGTEIRVVLTSPSGESYRLGELSHGSQTMKDGQTVLEPTGEKVLQWQLTAETSAIYCFNIEYGSVSSGSSVDWQLELTDVEGSEESIQSTPESSTSTRAADATTTRESTSSDVSGGEPTSASTTTASTPGFGIVQGVSCLGIVLLWRGLRRVVH